MGTHAPDDQTAPAAQGRQAPPTAAEQFLASLMPEDPRSRSRVVSALMRALLAERRLPS